MKSGEIPLGSEISISKLVFKLKTIAMSLRLGGGVLVLMGILGMGWIYLPLAYYQTRYFFKFQISNFKLNYLTSSRFGQALEKIVEEKPAWEVPDKNYSLFIPKIEARSKVIENVDVSKPNIYLPALQQGVAAAANLSRPGLKGTTFLFAHSVDSPLNFSRYNAIFYLLDKIETGDKVEIVYRNRLFKYQIEKTEILTANDLRYLVPQTDEERLVLQTCYPPGTSWKRLVVVAKRIP